ncbi:hypothetical protein AAG906_009109 [Vitis piasezkii]
MKSVCFGGWQTGSGREQNSKLSGWKDWKRYFLSLFLCSSKADSQAWKRWKDRQRGRRYCRVMNSNKYDILKTSVYRREPEPLKKLRALTAIHPWAAMATTPDSGQLLTMLLKLANAKKTIEIGVFTVYSLLLTALSIPDDGKLGNEGCFDFAYVDSDKVNSKNYHERLMKLVKIDGVVVCDNVFRRGYIAMPEELVSGWKSDILKSANSCVKLLGVMEQSGKKNPSKGLLQSEELYQYILETSVYPREPEPLKELRDITATHPKAVMATAPDAGQLMDMLLKLVNAKKTIEIGVFTGYSLLLTALSIPDDGKITAIDVDRQAYEMGLPVIRKAGVEHKINFMESQALPGLDQLLEEHENEGIFDFAFVDADKVNYKTTMRVVYDNTLRDGTVAMPEELVAENLRENRRLTIELNNFLAADPRVQICLAPLGDGITICRRVC